MSKPIGFFARLRALFTGRPAPAPAVQHAHPPRRRTHRKAPGAGIDYVTWQGHTKSYSDWSKSTGISETALRWRLQNGWPMDKAMTAPMRVVVRKKLGGTHAVEP